MRQRGEHKRIVKGEVEIIGHTFDIHHYIKPTNQHDMKKIVIQCYLPKVWLTEKDMKNMKAQMYIENLPYSIGELKIHSGFRVWGMDAEVYQLPSISSTLTKKLYVTAPRQTASKVSEKSICNCLLFYLAFKRVIAVMQTLLQ